MKEFLAVTQVLSDPNRVRTFMFLRRGELCLCQIIEMLGLAPSTVSKHMALLRQAGLVEARKDGRWHYYRLTGKNAPAAIRAAVQWVQEFLHGDQTILNDAERLNVVLKKDPKRLCDHYKKS